MARILAPLLSLRAWGTISKHLTFRRRKQSVDAVKTPFPTDAKTLIQRTQRLLFQDAVTWWHDLTTEERAAYDKPGREHHMSGYAWFIRSYLLNPPAATFLSLTDTPAVYVGEAGHPPIVNAAQDALEWGTIKEYPSGIIDLPSQSATRAWQTSNQVITPFIPQKLNLTSTSYDVQNEWSAANKRFTVTQDGKYQVLAAALYYDMNDHETGWLMIFKNGLTLSNFHFNQSAAAPDYLQMFVPDILDLVAGDFIELWVANPQGTNRNIWGAEFSTYIDITKIA